MASSRQGLQTTKNLEDLVRELQLETQKIKVQVNHLQEQIFALTEKLQAKQLPEKTSEELTPDEPTPDGPETMQDILWKDISERVNRELETDSLSRHRRDGDISTQDIMRRENSLKHTIPISYIDLLTKLKESLHMKPAVPYTQYELDKRFNRGNSIANYNDAEKRLSFYTNQLFPSGMSKIVMYEVEKIYKHDNGECCEKVQREIIRSYDQIINDLEVIRRLEAYISQEKNK